MDGIVNLDEVFLNCQKLNHLKLPFKLRFGKVGRVKHTDNIDIRLLLPNPPSCVTYNSQVQSSHVKSSEVKSVEVKSSPVNLTIKEMKDCIKPLTGKYNTPAVPTRIAIYRMGTQVSGLNPDIQQAVECVKG